jgi:hypothetical protein
LEDEISAVQMPSVGIALPSFPDDSEKKSSVEKEAPFTGSASKSAPSPSPSVPAMASGDMVEEPPTTHDEITATPSAHESPHEPSSEKHTLAPQVVQQSEAAAFSSDPSSAAAVAEKSSVSMVRTNHLRSILSLRCGPHLHNKQVCFNLSEFKSNRPLCRDC